MVLDSLKDRATAIYEACDSIDGIECNPVQGAMYAFPRIQMPQKAIDKAKVRDENYRTYFSSKVKILVS